MKKLSAFLLPFANRKSVQAAVLITDICVLLLVLSHRHTQAAFFVLIVLCICHYLLFQEKLFALGTNGDIRYKKYRKWSLWFLVTIFLCSLIPLFLRIYFEIKIMDILPEGVNHNFLEFGIAYELARDTLGIILFYDKEASAKPCCDEER